MSVTIAADSGSAAAAWALHGTVVASGGDPDRSEADMRHTTTTLGRHRGSYDVEAAVFWIFAGIILLIAFGDAIAVLAAVVAMVAAVAWIYRKIEHRFERDDAPAAPVTHLRLTSTGQHDAKKTWVQALSHRRHAA
jgi:hypothetical protein